jgi:hypothetical protein
MTRTDAPCRRPPPHSLPPERADPAAANSAHRPRIPSRGRAPKGTQRTDPPSASPLALPRSAIGGSIMSAELMPRGATASVFETLGGSSHRPGRCGYGLGRGVESGRGASGARGQRSRTTVVRAAATLSTPRRASRRTGWSPVAWRRCGATGDDLTAGVVSRQAHRRPQRLARGHSPERGALLPTDPPRFPRSPDRRGDVTGTPKEVDKG